MTPLNVVLAMLAASSNAVSNVLQRKANLEETTDEALSVRLVWRLVHNGVWIAAVVTIIALELPLTIIVVSFTIGSRLRRSELGAIVTMTAGLGLALVGLDPHGTLHPQVSMSSWVIGLPVTAAAVGTLVLVGRASTGALRAVLFGAATGIEFGMTAALMKGVTSAFARAASWPCSPPGTRTPWWERA